MKHEEKKRLSEVKQSGGKLKPRYHFCLFLKTIPSTKYLSQRSIPVVQTVCRASIPRTHEGTLETRFNYCTHPEMWRFFYSEITVLLFNSQAFMAWNQFTLVSRRLLKGWQIYKTKKIFRLWMQKYNES